MDNKEYCILGLDVSTKTIGVSLFNEKGSLLELTHISPKPKQKDISKTEELVIKAQLFYEFVVRYKSLNIDKILIEEPLLRSNNVHTVGTLLRFNGMITKICYDIFNIAPQYISTYEARKNAFPELMQPNATGKIVMFGSYPKDIDKKRVIWEKVSEREPQIKWLLDKKGGLKKENFDMSDSYVVGLSFMRMQGLID
jgi:hypothetical protein